VEIEVHLSLNLSDMHKNDEYFGMIRKVEKENRGRGKAQEPRKRQLNRSRNGMVSKKEKT